MLYQLLDSASPPHAAVVDVIRNLIKGDNLEWQNRTPGAFEPRIPLAQTLPATGSSGGAFCFVTFDDGTITQCFVMLNYYAFGKFAHDEGKGTLFATGVAGGTMKAGPMTWKKL